MKQLCTGQMSKITLLLFLISNTLIADEIKLNKLQSIASHNTYKSQYKIEKFITNNKVYNLEFDLHKRNFLLTRLSNDWHVYHHIFDNNSSYSSFREVLTDLKAFKNKNPSHQLITVFLDTDGFDGNNSISLFNSLLIEYIGKSLFTPKDVTKGCQDRDLVTSIKNCGWPSQSSLIGKFMFVLTSGNLKEYSKSNKQLAFLSSKPSEKLQSSVIYNVSYTNKKTTLPTNFLQRVYFVNTKEKIQVCKNNPHINFIAIDFK